MTGRTPPASPDQSDYKAVHADFVALLESARRAAARSANDLMTSTYMEIGRRFGRGFSVENL